jgi:aspartate/methionine/tyrosine aminotransferase
MLTVNGSSKAYSMTGWRIGYVAVPPSFIPGINTLRGLSCLQPGGAFYAWVNIEGTGMRSDGSVICRQIFGEICDH